MLADLRGRINIHAEYQRGSVWSEPQQQLLIDSILRGYDLPKIFLRRLPDGTELLFDVVDGVQRLTAIWRFLADEYPLLKNYPCPGFESLGGKQWSKFPQDAKDRLEFAKITVTEIEDATDDDIRELFRRLQQGEPLNAAETRNAIAGSVRDFVAETLSPHPFWQHTGLSQKRFGWHEMSAIVLALVRAQRPTGLKGADLLKLYEDESFDPHGRDANRAHHLLNQLDAIAEIEPGAVRTRWGVADLLLALMELDQRGIPCPAPSDMMTFFKHFENERREGAAELADLRSTIVELASDEIRQEDLEIPNIKLDMLTYLNAFTREGATEKNVETRAKVMVARLLQHFQDSST